MSAKLFSTYPIALPLSASEIDLACTYFEGPRDHFQSYNDQKAPLEERAGLRCDLIEKEAERLLSQLETLPLLCDSQTLESIKTFSIGQEATKLLQAASAPLTSDLADHQIPAALQEKTPSWALLLPLAAVSLNHGNGPYQYNKLQQAFIPSDEQALLDHFQNRYDSAHAFIQLVQPVTDALFAHIQKNTRFRRDVSADHLAKSIRLACRENKVDFSDPNWIHSAIEYRIGYDNYKNAQKFQARAKPDTPKTIRMAF